MPKRSGEIGHLRGDSRMESDTTISLPKARPRAQSLPGVRMARTIMALMLREMTTTYGRSPGGYLWSLLEPVGGIMILTLIFSAGLQLRQPSLGVSFAMFYATGMLPFMAYNRVQAKVAMSITYSRALLRYPSVTFVDAILARLLLNSITSTVILFAVCGGIMMAVETRVVLDYSSIFLALAMSFALGLGIGSVNAYLMPMFPVYASVWGILTTPLFFISGVLYTYEELPLIGREVLWYNPLMHLTGLMRKGFYPTYDANFVSPVYVFSIALTTLIVGLFLIRKNYRTIVDQSY